MEWVMILIAVVALIVAAALLAWSLKMRSQLDAERDRGQQQALDMQRQLFEKTIAELKSGLTATTEQLLKERQRDFAETSTKNIDAIIKPLQENIREMKTAMGETKTAQTAMTAEMKAKIEELVKQTDLTKQSADELTNALKHGSKVQGDWGEQVLDEMLEHEHLIRGIHYDIQAVIKDEMGNPVHGMNGHIMRPDVILHLDEKRDVIIDSKVSLTAFIDYVNAETETDRQMYLKAHLDSLWKHVQELSEKDYAAYIQPPKIKMDYVIMFIPNTGALWTAMRAQPDLWRKAMDKNVFIADEQTLFAAVRMINLTWTQIQQAANHEKVYELANEMVERVGMFMKHYHNIGAALEKAQAAYDDAEKKLAPTGQSVLTTAGKLIKLGAKQNTSYPVLTSNE